jgi:hypothetical protein
MRTKKIRMFAIAVVAFALTMTGAYALFSTTLNINGTANASADFEIDFTSANSSSSEATAVIGSDGSSLAINADLSFPGDSATINFVIKNTGTLSATVDNIAITNNSNSDLIVTVVGLDALKGTKLAVGEETTGSIVVTWNQASTVENPTAVTFNAQLDYSQTIN